MKNWKDKKTAVMAGVLAAAVACGGTGALAYAAGAAKSADTANTTESAEQTSAVNLSAGENASKEETVYVMTKADGTINKVIVSNRLTNPDGAATLNDVSDLKDITNVAGDETYTTGSNGSLTWNAQGQDIEYQGSTSKALPVGVSVTYLLDGKEIKPDALAGKSGRLTMRFDYTNNQYEMKTVNGKQEKIYVPFVMLTGMALDNDTFKNVTVSNGKLLNDGDRTYAVGFALPGVSESLNIDKSELDIPSSVTFTADVTNFSLTTILTLATNSMFQDMNFDKVSDLQDLTGSMNKLTDAMSQLLDGSSQLYTGLSELLAKSGELVDGVGALTDASGALYNGSSDLYSYLGQLTEGLSTLSANSNQVNSGAAMLVDAIFAGATTQLRSQLVAGGSMTQAEADKLTLTRDNYAAVFAKLAAATPNQTQITMATEQLTGQLTQNGVTDVPTQTLVLSLAEDLLTSNTYKTVAEAVTAAGKMATDGAAVAAVAGNQSAIPNMVSALAVASLKEQGMTNPAQISAAAPQAVATLKGELSAAGVTDTNQQMVILALADQLLTAGSQKTASADKVTALATAAVNEQLSVYTGGVDTAASSAGQITGGAMSLRDNLHTFYSKMNELKSKSGLLIDGVSQLKDGSMQLSDGLKQLNEQGIQKLADAVDGDLTGLTDRLQAMADLSKGYTSFSGAPEGVESSVKFVFRTDSIGE
ncbi:MAG: hypothetical protein GXW99_05780 [Clostridiales bacterium]|nr:hypothetical protein [Clostridiales bacterium]